MHAAVVCDSAANVKTLLARGIDPSIRSVEGKTAHDLAVTYENDKLAALLAKARNGAATTPETKKAPKKATKRS